MIATDICDGVFIVLFALVYAWIEIEIEGPNGWAKQLPTPQKVLAHLSLYHVYMVVLAALVIGGVLYYREKMTESSEKIWIRGLKILGEFIFLLILFFLAQDFLWFVMNPSYTVLRYSKAFVPWHSHWILGVPLFNYIGLAMLGILVALLHGRRKRLGITLGTCVGGVALLVCASPLYHMFYNRSHAPCFEGPQRDPSLCGSEVSRRK